MLHDILLVLCSGATIAAVLKFIEFLISHKTHKEEHKEDIDNKLDDVRTELKDHLTDVNRQWKLDYCDKNAQGIEELTQVSKELKDNVIVLTNTTADMKEYDKTLGTAVNGIIHDRIIHNVNEYINRKAITIEEISTLKSMYYPYKKLGGNGDVETAFEQAIKLPVVTKEEAIELDKIRKQTVYQK